MSADVKFSTQNQVKSKKTVITSIDVQLSTRKQVKNGHHAADVQ